MSVGNDGGAYVAPCGPFGGGRYVPPRLREVGARKGIDSYELLGYVAPDEEIVDWGRAGTEAVVLIVRTRSGLRARKIMADRFSACPWTGVGEGVMAPPALKGRYQVEYLTSLPEAARPYFPTVLAVHDSDHRRGRDRWRRGGAGDELIVDLSFVDGPSISELIAATSAPAIAVTRLYEEVLRLLRDKLHCYRVHPPPVERSSPPAYITKVAGRLGLTERVLPRTMNSTLLQKERIRYDGLTLRNWPWFVRTMGKRPRRAAAMEPPWLCLTMGDTNTENIKVTNPGVFLAALESGQFDFDYDDLGLVLLDPRGIGSDTTGAEVADDYVYDLKFWHNSIGNYDVFANVYYQLLLTATEECLDVRVARRPNPFDRAYAGVADYFSSVMGRTLGEKMTADPGWFKRFVFVMGTHFLAMLPFHVRRGTDGCVNDDALHQQGVVALYCEGLWWSNYFAALVMPDELAADERAALERAADDRFGRGHPRHRARTRGPERPVSTQSRGER